MEIMTEQQVRGNVNQENHGNQQHQGENRQVQAVNEQAELQAEPRVQERHQPRIVSAFNGVGIDGCLPGNLAQGNKNNRGNGNIGRNE